MNPGDAGGSIRKAEHEDNEYAHLWTDFPEVTEPSLGKVVTKTTPLHITTDGPPVYTPCRKLTAKIRCRWKNNSDSGKQKTSLSDVTLIGHHRYMQ